MGCTRVYYNHVATLLADRVSGYLKSGFDAVVLLSTINYKLSTINYYILEYVLSFHDGVMGSITTEPTAIIRAEDPQR